MRLLHVFGLDAGEAEHLEDAVGQGLFGVALAQVEVEAELLHDGYAVRFDKLDEVAVRVLDVGEVSACVAHGERLGVALLLFESGTRVNLPFVDFNMHHIEKLLKNTYDLCIMRSDKTAAGSRGIRCGE